MQAGFLPNNNKINNQKFNLSIICVLYIHYVLFLGGNLIYLKSILNNLTFTEEAFTSK